VKEKEYICEFLRFIGITAKRYLLWLIGFFSEDAGRHAFREVVDEDEVEAPMPAVHEL